MALKVLIVTKILAHYRLDVYRGIQDAEGLDVEFVAGSSRLDSSIASIPSGSLKKVHTVRNAEFKTFLWQRGLLRILRGRKPEVVVFQGDSKFLSTWISALMLRAQGVGVLFWTIGWHRPEAGIKRIYKVTFYRLAHKLLIYGVIGRNIGISMGYPLSRMTVVYNSSSNPVEQHAAEPFALERFQRSLPPPGSPVVTAVIRLNPVKRLDMLIEASSILREGGCQLSVLLVGEGPEQDRLVHLALSLGVPLYLPGPAYGSEELSLVYERTTVTVVPACAGLTTLQSFKHGVPVITHDFEYEQMPESEAIVPGFTGDYYSYDNVDSLAKTIEFWVDKQARDSVSTAARCRAVVSAKWSASAQSDVIVKEVRQISEQQLGGRVL